MLELLMICIWLGMIASNLGGAPAIPLVIHKSERGG